MTTALDVSVVIPTIGRPTRLHACLASLDRCDPRAGEVVVVDQSGTDEIARVVSRFQRERVRLVDCSGRGRGRAVNRGLKEAHHDVVLITDDDCTVEMSWVGTGWAELDGTAEPMIVTGRVLSAGDPNAVPSLISDPVRRDIRHPKDAGMLYAGNMACRRTAILDLGGFDERIRPAAEDVDLCYRWLRAGRLLRYEPRLVVWHADWRNMRELEELYVGYGYGIGVFCGKHLRRGDIAVLRFLGRELYGGLRGVAARRVRGRPPWSDSRQGALRGLPGGLRDGWRTFRKENAATPADVL